MYGMPRRRVGIVAASFLLVSLFLLSVYIQYQLTIIVLVLVDNLARAHGIMPETN